MIKIMKLILFIAIFLTLTGCPDKYKYPDYILEIKNTSTKDLVYNYDKLYPDTLLWDESPFSELNIEQLIIPAKSIEEIGFFDDQFSGMAQGQKIRLFLFDREIIDTNPWDTIRNNYLVLRRYDLSIEDLNQLNWVITYP